MAKNDDAALRFRIGNLLDGMTLAEIPEHYPSVALQVLQRLVLQAGDALCREALSPLVGQRRRRADGSAYTVTGIVGSDTVGDWAVAVENGDGEVVVMMVADVLEDAVVEDKGGGA